MKKILVNLIMVAMVLLMIAPSVSAQSDNVSKDNSFQNGLSEKLTKEVDPYVKVVGSSYELSNLAELKTKISKTDLDNVKKQLAETNTLLKQNANLEKTSDNAFKVEMTDQEMKEKATELGYGYDLNASAKDNHNNQLFAKNGINKVKIYWWGFELWLSKTSVGNILSGGVAAAALVLGILIPGVGIAIALAANSYIWGIFANQNARAVYFQYNVFTGLISNFRYQ